MRNIETQFIMQACTSPPLACSLLIGPTELPNLETQVWEFFEPDVRFVASHCKAAFNEPVEDHAHVSHVVLEGAARWDDDVVDVR